MVNIRTESPIDTNFSVQFGTISNFQKKIFRCYIYINGSKVYPGETTFILHSKKCSSE